MMALASPLGAADAVQVSVGTVTYPARAIGNAAVADVSAPIIFGGSGITPIAAWSGKIVLVDRGGGVSFFDKVRAVQVTGGLAVIIANNVPGPANTGTLGTDNSSTIPAVAVSQADGAALKLQAGEVVRVGSAEPVVAGPVVVPDPRGHAGEFLWSDGIQLRYSANAEPSPSVSISLEVAVGKPALFTVSAWGATPFTYQWMKNGVVIPGESGPVLNILSVKATDAGNYVCVVSNSSGSTASRAATLVVK